MRTECTSSQLSKPLPFTVRTAMLATSTRALKVKAVGSTAALNAFHALAHPLMLHLCHTPGSVPQL